MYLTRRKFGLLAGTGAAVSLAAGFPARAAAKEIRVGFQKYGVLVLLKGKGLLEERLQPLGYTVRWAEFAAGPQMLEALNAGAIDIAQTGEAPPIFAQAASPRLTYVAFEPPAPKGEAILVPKDSPIGSVGDLRGRKVALNKGSNVHYLLVRALESAGVGYQEIQPTFLTPADARAAFASGAVDAWAIWDPFQASAEQTLGARELVNAEGLAPNYQFYLGDRSFVAENPQAIEGLLTAIHDIGVWISDNPRAAADELAPSTGIPADALERALGRQSFGGRSDNPGGRCRPATGRRRLRAARPAAETRYRIGGCSRHLTRRRSTPVADAGDPVRAAMGDGVDEDGAIRVVHGEGDDGVASGGNGAQTGGDLVAERPLVRRLCHGQHGSLDLRNPALGGSATATLGGQSGNRQEIVPNPRMKGKAVGQGITRRAASPAPGQRRRRPRRSRWPASRAGRESRPPSPAAPQHGPSRPPSSARLPRQRPSLRKQRHLPSPWRRDSHGAGR